MIRDDDKTSKITRNDIARETGSAAFVLEVTLGADRGRTLRIDRTAQRLYIGKSETSDLRLTDPEVSRRHAALELIDRHLQLTDLGSTNGTMINGVRAGDARLEGGELVVVGRTTLQVRRAVGSSDPPPDARLTRFGRIVGSSPQITRLFPLLERLSQSDIPVILEGETGTGKELVAESIHEASRRTNGPFIVFDCTSVPPGLVEAALFGHEKGAFTGAHGTRQGVFEQADEGTLLIDEIGDLDVALQSKLLRAIERSEVQRVGGNAWIRVSVRLISATRRDLEREIQEGRFRDDLYYRLAVARVELPPLRARTGDVETLVRHFWSTLGGDPKELTADLIRRFETYAWPGNVRELHNAVAHRIALGDLADLRSIQRPSEHPPPAGAEEHGAADVVEAILAQELPFTRARDLALADFERRYCEWALAKYSGNVSRAAAASGIARRYFYVIRNRSAKGT